LLAVEGEQHQLAQVVLQSQSAYTALKAEGRGDQWPTFNHCMFMISEHAVIEMECGFMLIHDWSPICIEKLSWVDHILDLD
jgi:hypothetical protein